MAIRRSVPVATTDFPSGETTWKRKLTPSGVMARGLPSEMSWTKSREPRPGSLPEMRTRRPSGNHVAAWELMPVFASCFGSPAPVGSRKTHDLAAGGGHRAEQTPVAGDVLEECSGRVPDGSALPRERGRRDDAAPARPDFVSSRRPGEPHDRVRAIQPDLAARIHDFHAAVVVSAHRVVDEGDKPPVRRDADAVGPARRLVQHFSNRVLDAVAVSRLARHG